MAFSVETGSVYYGVNSYVSVAYADEYHTDRGNDSWTGTDAVKQSALINATDYIEQLYAGRWNGELVMHDQDLQWPRYGFIDPEFDEIPDRLKQAVCILALEALSGSLNPSLNRAVKREKVDVIEVEYMDNASERIKRPAVDGLVKPYLIAGALNAKVVRV